MAFWAIAMLIAGLCAAVVAVAVLRPRAAARDSAAVDLEFYRQQLSDVERDIGRGVLSADEGQRVRNEVARRVLDADKRQTRAASAQSRGGLILAAIAVVGVLAGSVYTYLRLGAPNYPDLPIAVRLADANDYRANRLRQSQVEANITTPPDTGADVTDEYADLVVRLREAVHSRPDDLQGHLLLAQHEARLGNYKAAHEALGRAIEIKGDSVTAEDWTNLADLMIISADGYVSPEAEQALSRALALDPQNGTARYYVGLMFAQTGRPDRAFEFWRSLLDNSAPDDPWIAPIRAQIEDVAADAGINYSLPGQALRGPSASDVASAQDMSENDRVAMIEGMVANLSERLGSEGGPPEEWARLIRSLGVLGKTENARQIADEARRVFDGDQGALRLIEDAAASIGEAGQ